MSTHSAKWRIDPRSSPQWYRRGHFQGMGHHAALLQCRTVPQWIKGMATCRTEPRSCQTAVGMKRGFECAWVAVIGLVRLVFTESPPLHFHLPNATLVQVLPPVLTNALISGQAFRPTGQYWLQGCGLTGNPMDMSPAVSGSSAHCRAGFPIPAWTDTIASAEHRQDNLIFLPRTVSSLVLQIRAYTRLHLQRGILTNCHRWMIFPVLSTE